MIIYYTMIQDISNIIGISTIIIAFTIPCMIKTYRSTSDNLSITIDKADKCSLCLDPFSKTNNICIPVCGHSIHLDCYNNLQDSNCVNKELCPICKTEIKKKSNKRSTRPPEIYTRISRISINSNGLNNISTLSPPHSPISRPTTRSSSRHRNLTDTRSIFNPSRYHLDNWSLYTDIEKEIIIERLFQNERYNQLVERYQDTSSLIISPERLRNWNNYTDDQRELMINQLFN